ncbi:MAG: hypothetical protein LBV43_08010 [Prevotella sp.]|nr:hypothetical protein [Prevotella sp.]
MTEDIQIWVNDTLKYNGKFRPGYESSFSSDMLLTYINKGIDIKRIKISVGNNDTIFYYPIKDVDSIVIVHNKYDKPSFFIWNDNDERVWVSE